MTTGFPTPRDEFLTRRGNALVAMDGVDDRIKAIAMRIAVIAAVLGALLGLLIHLLAVVPLAAAGGAAGWFVARNRANGALAAADKTAWRPAPEGAAAERMGVVLENVALQAGVPVPELLVSGDRGINAATVVRAEGPAIVVTADLLAVADVVVLEGIVARQLRFLDDGTAHGAAWHDAIDTLPEARLVPGPDAETVRDGVPLETAADIAGVAITRYPPGLAAGLSAAADAAPITGLTTRLDTLALVPATAAVAPKVRAETLAEL